jgi:hypothetical protein
MSDVDIYDIRTEFRYEDDPHGAACHEIERLRAALKEIKKGEGPFDRDPLLHAGNVIEDMKEIASRALGEEVAG